MSNTKWTERRIQVALFQEYAPDLLIPNVQLSTWEADLVRLTSSMFIHEYEIKISRSDFRADFTSKRWTKRTRHQVLSGEMLSRETVPNRFWYVAPFGLIRVEELPTYAGLIEIGEGAWNKRYCVKVTKAAPVIHKQKHEDVTLKLLRVLGWRYWHWRERDDFKQHEIENP